MKLDILSRYCESAADGVEWRGPGRQWHAVGAWLCAPGECIVVLTDEERAAIERWRPRKRRKP